MFTFTTGGMAGARTRDQRIKSPVLYQLSYHPTTEERNYDAFFLRCQIDNSAKAIQPNTRYLPAQRGEAFSFFK